MVDTSFWLTVVWTEAVKGSAVGALDVIDGRNLLDDFLVFKSFAIVLTHQSLRAQVCENSGSHPVRDPGREKTYERGLYVLKEVRVT